MFSLNIKGGIPVYEQLAARITELICSGAMVPEERLPPVREIAKAHGLNPNTVQKTYQLLEVRGLIYTVPAKGSYVSPGGDAAKAQRKTELSQFSQIAEQALRRGVTAGDLREHLETIIKKQGGERNDSDK